MGFGVSVSVSAIGEIDTRVYASGKAGYYDNPCDSSCPYGNISVSSSILGHVGGSIGACIVLFGQGLCADVGVDGFVHINFGGNLSLNGCGDCGGVDGGLYISECYATLKITWLGNEFVVGNVTIYE